ncbi:uncharacterized protein LOC112467986 [Temnothorax curvispinosus]|uniref:Uncharacterized protein LOC112467986 n=1 Tax=Temnothorax curvispinosus TaxID=300111 RepID=A0A6J1RCP5_9HYME|nr:uncharacterized protein LOC112467986 [Temnothorax curvispinosus]
MTHLFVVVHAVVVPAYIHTSGARLSLTRDTIFVDHVYLRASSSLTSYTRCPGLHCQLHLAVRSYLCSVLSVTPADEPHSSAVRRKVSASEDFYRMPLVTVCRK